MNPDIPAVCQRSNLIEVLKHDKFRDMQDFVKPEQ